MLVYASVMYTLFGAGMTVMLVNYMSMGAFIKFVYSCYFILAYWLVCILGKRFQSKFMTMVCFLVVLDHLAGAITTELLVAHANEQPRDLMAVLVTITTTIHVLFLSPSLMASIFYISVYYVNISQMLLRHADPDDPDAASSNKTFLVNRILTGIC